MVLRFIHHIGKMKPAILGGIRYQGQIFGSETSKRCRELRALGLLDSHKEGKFAIFTLTSTGKKVAKKLK